MKAIQVAAIAHAINSAYCLAIGDKVAPPLTECPEDMQQGILAGVQLHIDNPDTTPEQSHESWLADKLANGWTYGEEKDFEKKTHPCCRPYAELPESQKVKDHLFRAVVHALKDVPDAEDAVAEALAKIPASLTVAAAVQPSAVAGAGLVGVEYIGRRELWRDTTYDSGLTFTSGQIRGVPQYLARKLLRHVDLFKQVELPAAEPVHDDTAALLAKPTKAAVEREEQQQDFAVIDQVNQMTDKDALITFAARQNLKLTKTMKVETMRERIVDQIKRFGTQ